MKLLLIDNYDSFTYNLLKMFSKDERVSAQVRRNDQVDIEEIAEYDILAFSPGPGLPQNAGKMMQIIRHYADSKPMFGVCLGLQAMAMVFGAKLYNMKIVKHGVPSQIHIDNSDDPLFMNLPSEFSAGRYHSWAIDPSSVPSCFQPIASDEEGVIMAARHTTRPIYGVQFHPESVMTPQGQQLITNFINLIE